MHFDAPSLRLDLHGNACFAASLRRFPHVSAYLGARLRLSNIQVLRTNLTWALRFIALPGSSTCRAFLSPLPPRTRGAPLERATNAFSLRFMAFQVLRQIYHAPLSFYSVAGGVLEQV